MTAKKSNGNGPAPSEQDVKDRFYYETLYDFELIDEEDPEVFQFDETFVKTLHKLGISAQKFLDTWTETIKEYNREMLKELVE